MILTVYFDHPDMMGYPFNNRKYFESYKSFAMLCERQNVTVYFSRAPGSYEGNMRFTQGFQFRKNTLIPVKQPFTTDWIFLKGYQLKTGAQDKTLNNPAMAYLCHNKLKTYSLFHSYMGKTSIIASHNYQTVLPTIPSQRVVLKPVFDSEGKGIHIIDKKDFSPSLFSEYEEYFVQEFLDSSSGVPGILKGYHDLRLILFNGEVKNSYIRVPKKGSLLANLAQGGRFVYVSSNRIPESARFLACTIDKKFSHFSPRLYAVDMLYEQGKPYLIELNDQPGMPYLEENKYENSATKFHSDLLSLFRI